MKDIFGDLIDVCMLVYLDNILIYSNSEEEHLWHVCEVLCHLRQHNLYTCANKCFFHVQKVKYLGYILSPSGLTMAADEFQVIQDWPEPWKIKDIQSFLDFANFYRHFILHYSDITIPLTHLTCKGTAWDFSDKCCSTFNMLKKAFTITLVLMHWIPGSPLIIKTDMSDYALAAILSMVCPTDNELHPIAFHSYTFTPPPAPKLNYDVHNKEPFAIFKAFKIWCHYLKGTPTQIDVVMDHKNLEYFSTTKLLIHPLPSPLVGISLSVRPHHSFLPQLPGHQAQCTNEIMGCLY